MTSTSIRVAAVLLWTTGVGLGIFCLPAIRNLLAGRDIPHRPDSRQLGKSQVVFAATLMPWEEP
jgi:hypothetical protein